MSESKPKFAGLIAAGQALSYVLAWSAAVDLKTMNARKADGQFIYARGRYKYLGLGALVLFFAGFAAYGMAHMLASMAHLSATAAGLGGLIWGWFQWCLERQMMMSIRSDASLPVKLMGLSWRASLALLSALTMVYPFFVDTNRSEIELRTSQLERVRLQENRQSAEAASGLNVRQQEASLLAQNTRAAELALASDAPHLAVLRQQLLSLRAQAAAEEVRQQHSIRGWQQQLAEGEPGSQQSLQHKIQHAQQRIQQARMRLQGAEHEWQIQDQRWRQQKQREYVQMKQELLQAQERTQQARQEAQAMQQQQTPKIQAAAHAGFAADFAASWDMLQQDAHRRWQFIWWFSWFYLIEIIVMLVKLTHHTELDARLSADERLVLGEIASQLRVQQAQLALSEQQAMTQIKAQMLALEADQGLTQAALSLLQPLQQVQEQAQAKPQLTSPLLQQLLQDTLHAVQSQFLRRVNKA